MNKHLILKKLVILILSFILVHACYKTQTKKSFVMKVTDFKKTHKDSIKVGFALPTFVGSYWDITGFVNDTVIINLNNDNDKSKIYLKGIIDFQGFDDGVGFGWNYIIIEPYKAKKGFIRAERRLEP